MSESDYIEDFIDPDSIGFAPPISTHPCVIIMGTQADYELKAIKAFYERVCQRAEQNMRETGRLEGAHFAAMKAEITALEQAAQIAAAAKADSAARL